MRGHGRRGGARGSRRRAPGSLPHQVRATAAPQRPPPPAISHACLGPPRRHTPLEWSLPEQSTGAVSPRCFVKLLCDRAEGERLVGLHVVGDHAAETVQGFALAVRLGATKADFDATIGIHPCAAEELVRMSVTKRSGDDPAKGGC